MYGKHLTQCLAHGKHSIKNRFGLVWFLVIGRMLSTTREDPCTDKKGQDLHSNRVQPSQLGESLTVQEPLACAISFRKEGGCLGSVGTKNFSPSQILSIKPLD